MLELFLVSGSGRIQACWTHWTLTETDLSINSSYIEINRASASERQLEPDEDYKRVLSSVNVMAEHHGRQMLYRLIKWMPTVQATGPK